MSRSEHILVVDDEPTTRHMVTFALRQAGYKVSVAACGDMALILAGNEQFDLIVTDYYMPDRTGTDVIRELRETPGYTATPCILLTARADELNLQHIRDDLLVFIVRKPFSPAAFFDLVSTCLAKVRSAC